MSLQERHQAFLGVIDAGGIPFDYYKPFAPPQFACTQPVRLMDIGYKDASRGDVVQDYLDNSLRRRPEVPRWGVLQYVLRGEMRVIDHGKEKMVGEGQAALFAVPSETAYYDPVDSDARWFFITFCGAAAMGVVDEVDAKNGSVLSGLERSRLVPMSAHLFAMASAHAVPNLFTFSAALYDILMELAAEVLSYRKNYPEPIAHALELMDHQFGDSSLSLESLAAKVGLSKYYFARMFKENLGESPGVYLQEKRMQTAMDLLLRTNQPVKEIQYLCGFSSYSYFLTVFRKFYGMPPGAVRAQ
jgi:AraC-like DNA-binding protein